MEPNSTLLIVLLFAAAVACVAVATLWRVVWQRIVAGVLSILISTVAGIAAVNDFYGYYTSWGQLSSDLSGSYASFSTTVSGSREVGGVRRGEVLRVDLPGALSGIDRSGLVYLPPQYFEPAYRTTRFPVVELIHGTPGTPQNWVVNLGTAAVMDRLLQHHQLGPMVLVMPTMSVGHDFEECVNAPGARDDTYITRDVRSDILARFRVATGSAQWGIAGYSSGGYCAVNLALRHRGAFGAAGAMDGYFRPTDGPAAAALHFSPVAEAANDPLRAAAALSRGVAPLPSFWLSAGTGNGEDVAAARAFALALHGIERVTLYREPGAAHNFDAWRPAIPHLLAWLWTQLAPPELRVSFPISGPVGSGVIATQPLAGGENVGRRTHPSRPARSPANATGAGLAFGGRNS